MPECIVVVPCFNEAQRLNVRAFIEHSVRDECSLLFVNDGSDDGTGDLLDELCAASPANLSVLHLPRNCGKAEAVRQGMLRAIERQPAYIGYWDADLATPLEAIREFRDYLHVHPAVEVLLAARVRLLGRKIERRRSRHLAGRLFAAAASHVLRLPVYDTQCGAKLLRNTDRTRALFAEPFCSRWIFDVELLARFVLASAAAGKAPVELIHELPLQSWHDVAGSKLRASDFFRAAIQLAGIAWHYRRLGKPRATPGRECAAEAPPSSPTTSRPGQVPASEWEAVS